MKQRSTTPVSKGLTTKTFLVALSIIVAVSTPFVVQPQVSADKYDDQIKALQREIDQYQAQAGALSSQIKTLQLEMQSIESQKRVIQAQIEISQTKFNQLQDQIKATEQSIIDNKSVLGKTIANLYIDDKISPLEMLASSKNIGDYVDKQTYRSSVRDQLSVKIETIKTLKKELEQQKTDVQRTLADQNNSRKALTDKENERGAILAQTQGQEGAYRRLSTERESQKLKIQQQQQAAIEAAMRRASGNRPVNVLPGDPNKGGYPWEANCYVDANAVSHGGADGNGGDPLGTGCRQCVSYTAWKVLQKTGYAPRYWGNANQWPGSARAAGFTTGSTPRVGSIGVISAGQYGHVVWIEAVNDDGTVDVSQYNYFNAGGAGWGHYSKMRVSAATYDTYIYF